MAVTSPREGGEDGIGGLPDGVVATADAVRRGEVSAVEVTAAHLEATRASQAELNAFTFVDERALSRAAQIDASVSSGQDPGRLAGVPLAMKDLIDQAELPNTLGTSAPPHVPDKNATVVERLEEAGAVIIGRAGLHEYAFGFSSENHWFGPVRNPWDVSLSPGGSSGGSAAAVAAHLVAGSVGTDTGGSVRVPAALCGLVGLKVTHGRVSLNGVFPLAPSIDTVGPLARSVADAAALYEVMAGYDATDQWSANRAVVSPGTAHDLATLRIGVPHPWVDAALSPDQHRGFLGVLTAFAEEGAEVVHLDLPALDPPGEIEAAFYPEVAAVHRDRFAAMPQTYGPETAERLSSSLAVEAAGVAQKGREWSISVRTSMAAALGKVDVLVTPTVAALKKTIGSDTITIAQTAFAYRAVLSRFTSLVNQAKLPAIALPLNTAGAPPPSIQLIGSAWSEHRLLEISLALETSGMVAVRRPPPW